MLHPSYAIYMPLPARYAVMKQLYPLMQPLTQRPHLLQMPDHRHIRIHKPIHTVLHARLFAAIEFAGGDLGGHASSWESDQNNGIDGNTRARVSTALEQRAGGVSRLTS